jgi:hypothetical protein
MSCATKSREAFFAAMCIRQQAASDLPAVDAISTGRLVQGNDSLTEWFEGGWWEQPIRHDMGRVFSKKTPGQVE